MRTLDVPLHLYSAVRSFADVARMDEAGIADTSASTHDSAFPHVTVVPYRT